MDDKYSNKKYQFFVITYNQKDLVLRALNSIKKQVEQYGKDKLIELNIFDDSSSDGSIEVVDDWINNYAQIISETFFNINEVNLGIKKNVYKAREKITSNKYFMLAGDDEFNPSTNVFEYMDYCSGKMVVLSPYLVHGEFRFNELLFWGRVEFFKMNPNLLSRIILWRNVIPAPGSYVNPAILHGNEFKEYYWRPSIDAEDYITWIFLFNQRRTSFQIFYNKVLIYHQSNSNHYLKRNNEVRNIFAKIIRSINGINEMIFTFSTVIGLFYLIIFKRSLYLD